MRTCTWQLVAVGLLVTACMRMNYDEQSAPDTIGLGPDGGAPVDQGVAGLSCPSEMAILHPTGAASFCVDIDESGTLPWQEGADLCAAAGKRYCTGVEWDYACNEIGSQLVGMSPSSNWEWVAELADATTAYKRSDCDSPGSHTIVDPYEVRCCMSAL